jgi:hypothetical protein
MSLAESMKIRWDCIINSQAYHTKYETKNKCLHEQIVKSMNTIDQTDYLKKNKEEKL